MSAEERLDPEAVAAIVERVAAGHNAEAAAEFIADALEKQNASIDRRAFRLIRENRMTPDVAVQLWLERYAMRNLVVGLNDAIQTGKRSQKDHPLHGSTLK